MSRVLQATLEQENVRILVQNARNRYLEPTDADSSQLSALMDIAAGKNLVIEGPPGTGKSQTITNAIAAAIYDGKTVLFVAEKLAALEVVHSKLADLGLADFCLELHSDASSPRQVFDSFRQRLEASYQRPQQLEAIQEELNRKKQLIAEYLKASNQKVGPFDEPVHELLWRVISQRARGLWALRSAECECRLSRAQFEDNAQLLEAFAETMLEIERPRKSPWWGFWPDRLNPNDCQPVRDRIVRLAELGREADATTQELDGLVARKTAAWVESHLGEQLPLSALRNLQSRASSFPEKLDLQGLLDVTARRDATKLCELIRRVQSLEPTAANRVRGDLSEAATSAATLYVALEKELLPLAPHATWNELIALKPRLDNLLKTIGDSTDSPQLIRLGSGGTPVRKEHWLKFIRRVERLGDLAESIRVGNQQLDLEVGEGASHWASLRKGDPKFVAQLRRVASDARDVGRLDDARRLANPAARRLSEQLCEQLSESRTLANQVLPKLLSDLDSSAHGAESLALIISKGVLPVIPKATWGDARNLKSRIGAILDVMESAGDTLEQARAQGLGSVRTLGELEESEFLCKLVRHPIVHERSEVPAALFFRSASSALEHGQAEAKTLISERARLDECFDLASAPSMEGLRKLTKTLRVYEGSWWRFMSREFRRARRELATFARSPAATKTSLWIERLEAFQKWIDACSAFESNEDLKKTFGEQFCGLETDWERCKTTWQWVITAQGKRLDHASACNLLQLRDPGALAAQQVVRARKQIAAELCDPSTLAALGFSSAVRIADVPFALVVQRGGQLRNTLESMEQAATSFVVPDDQALEEVSKWCRKVVRAAEIARSTDEASAWAGLGSWYEGVDTDIDSLKQAQQWANELAALNLPPALDEQIFSVNAAQRLDKFANLFEEQFRLLEEWKSNSSSFAEIADWVRQIREPLEKAIEAVRAFVLSGEESLLELAEYSDEVQQYAKLTKELDDAKCWKSLGSWYAGRDTQADLLQAATEWIECLKPVGLPHDAERFLSQGYVAGNCQRLILLVEQAEKIRLDWHAQRSSLLHFGKLDETWLPWALAGDVHGKNIDKLEMLLATLDDLPAWSAFCRSMASCKSHGLASFTDAVLDVQVEPAKLTSCYRFTVLERIAETALWNSATLKTFSRKTIEKARQHYQELDRDLLRVNRSLVAHQSASREPPSGNSRGRVGEYSELGLIRHEITKQRRHCRIRDFLQRAGSAAQTLKPCFMMSPLSVAQFLAPDGVEFDLVIMDEASQVKPEDALGTLLRANQIVVVGDPKQLPPTSFFDRMADDVADADATQFDNTESVLEVAMKSFQPVRRLRWHYRSRHESLIHFSNDRFYDGDLVIFPSASGATDGLGLRHHYVEGASFSGGCNSVEAERVARAIVQHALTYPQEPLGVGTFNLKQSVLIQDWLQRLCEADSAAREAVELLETHPSESLFVNNLETLQGHERDVIFISYTYGPDPVSGRVMNRFGPVTGAAGWRRINVLVTRARRRVEVFASMRPSDILGGPDKSLGVNAFKDYLEYSSSGVLPDRGILSSREMESPFEEAVARVITRMGLEVVPQVGVAGYFIDLGVRQPGKQDFLLGIECDGASYHSARSARDRDRLREEVIQSRGWKLHRVWSTDWYLNQKHEEERLTQVLATLSNHSNDL